MRYSVIIPVYNRPDEVRELLESLTQLSYKGFEVLIIEDGSTSKCAHIVHEFNAQLKLRYFEKENNGQGFSRNYGFERARGDYFVVFDSDCLIPAGYFDAVNERIDKGEKLDCWGGPDRAHSTFTPIQKAINHAMTSLFTTGGTRGNQFHVGTYHPRSFNMGISREIYEATGGYKITRMGEDLEFSIRIQKAGFKTEFIEEAFVYHKRRTNFIQFYKQLFFFGRARINIWRFHPKELKPIHFIPAVFTTGFFYSLVGSLFSLPLAVPLFFLYISFMLILFLDAYRTENNIKVALLSSVAGIIQLIAYGLGFLKESLRGKKIKTQ